MNPRFEQRRKQLLKDVQVRPQVYLGMLERLYIPVGASSSAGI